MNNREIISTIVAKGNWNNFAANVAYYSKQGYVPSGNVKCTALSGSFSNEVYSVLIMVKYDK